MKVDQFFSNVPNAGSLYRSVEMAIREIGPSQQQITKSQIAFHTTKPFAYLWIPARYLKGRSAPLVLSIALSYRDETVPWKEVYQVKKLWYMHHKEIWTADDIDQTLLDVLTVAYHASKEDHA